MRGAGAWGARYRNARRVASPRGSETERGAHRDHRCAAGVDGVDDLGVVDAVEVDRGDAEVAVAQLALDDDERHALVGHLDGVGVAQLVRRETPANACGRRRAAQLGPRRVRRPWSSSGRAVDDAEQRADRELEAHIDPTLQVLPGPLVHTDLAPAPALAAAHEQGSATVVEVRLVERERVVDPK